MNNNQVQFLRAVTQRISQLDKHAMPFSTNAPKKVEAACPPTSPKLAPQEREQHLFTIFFSPTGGTIQYV